jgi:hypothetical protein
MYTWQTREVERLRKYNCKLFNPTNYGEFTFLQWDPKNYGNLPFTLQETKGKPYARGVIDKLFHLGYLSQAPTHSTNAGVLQLSLSEKGLLEVSLRQAAMLKEERSEYKEKLEVEHLEVSIAQSKKALAHADEALQIAKDGRDIADRAFLATRDAALSARINAIAAKWMIPTTIVATLLAWLLGKYFK